MCTSPEKRYSPGSLVCRWLARMSMILFLLFVTAAGLHAQEQAAAKKVVATINGREVTEEQLRVTIQGKLFALENEIYNLKKEGLEELIGNYLLEQEATRRNITIDQLVKEEIDNKLSPLTDAEVERFYAANKNRINRPLEQIRPQLVQYLQNLSRTQQREAFLNTLRAQANIVTFLQPPRLEVSAGDSPAKGPEDALITIIEFSDFQCPFCKRVLPTLEQVLATYAGKVRLVFRDFPLLSIHPRAQRSAEAAQCAREQGKFWEYHDALFANQDQLEDSHLTDYARTLGLDIQSFEQCLASNKYTASVQADLTYGTQLGVSGTPAFFINGRLLSGAQPFEAFQAIIEEELRLAQQ